MFKVSKEKLQQILASGLTQESQDSMVGFDSTKCFEDSLKSNIAQGLSNDDLRERQQIFGANWNQNVDSISVVKAFWILLIKPKSIIFFTLSLIALILKYSSTQENSTNELTQSLVIFIFLGLNLIIQVYQIKNADDKKKQKLILDEQSKKIIVLRNGQEQNIIAKDLVVGDIVILQENDKLYVDGLIVEQNNLYINEQYLTGEEDFIHKITLEEAIDQKQSILLQKHLVYSGSQVREGSGKLLVLAVGSQIQINQIQKYHKQEEKKTPILQTIENISFQIDRIELLGAIFVIFTLIALYILDQSEQNINRYSSFSNLLNLIIVLKPGFSFGTLIFHFQIQLVQFVKQMLYQQNLVRNLSQIEYLPYVDQVLVDQTGVLTQNTMKLDSFMNDTIEELTSSQYNLYPQEFQQAFIDACFINTTYNRCFDEGSSDERALYRFSQDMKINLEERLKQVTHKIPFDDIRKIQTVVINNNKVTVKGSAEQVLQKSTKFYSLKNGIVAIDNVLKEKIEQLLTEMCNKGIIIGIAYRDVNLQNENVEELIQNNKFEFDRQNLTLLGFLLFVDPLRYETISTVQGFKQAGVKVVIITENNSIRAKNVAIEAGIMQSDQLVMEGSDFTKLLQKQTEISKKEIEDIYVLSRATPQNKYNLIRELQELGHIVGVCCDGTNDAPSLSRADVGYSLGIAGSEVARYTSGIILLDDNIHSIYKGLIFSRNLIDSIKRQAQYQILSQFYLIIILITSAAYGETVISPLQFIWISLINDLFATFVLSNCIPSSQLKYQKPSNYFILNGFILIHIIILSVYIIIVCIIFVHNSLMIFNLFVMTMIFNLINSRMVYLEFNIFRGFFQSWIIYTPILIIGILQFVIVQYGGNVMNTFDGLNLYQWLICIAIGLGVVVWRTIAILIIKPIIGIFNLKVEQKNHKEKLKIN